MDLRWFKDLEVLSETGNFSQAAEQMHVTQPALSRRIKAIEDWVGVTLVDRRSRPVKLTTAGRLMLESGRQALFRVENERELVRASFAHPERYIVNFAAQHSIGWRFYPSWLQALEEAFGPILSRLRADDLPNCIEDLKKGDVDFVIAYRSDNALGFATFTNMEFLTIGDDTLVPVCKTTEGGAPLFNLDSPDTPPVPYLRFSENAPIREHLLPLDRAQKMIGRVSVVYENSMSGALRIRARDGAGVAWLPYSLVKPDIDTGLLTFAGKRDWWVRLDICIYRIKTKSNPLTQDIWSFVSGRNGFLFANG